MRARSLSDSRGEYPFRRSIWLVVSDRKWGISIFLLGGSKRAAEDLDAPKWIDGAIFFANLEEACATPQIPPSSAGPPSVRHVAIRDVGTGGIFETAPPLRAVALAAPERRRSAPGRTTAASRFRSTMDDLPETPGHPPGAGLPPGNINRI